MLDFSRGSRSSLILYLLMTVLVIALFLDGNKTIQSIEQGVQDSMFRFRSERTPSGQVLICALDDGSAQRMGWPMQRDSLAHLLLALKQAGASVVVCDFDWRHVAPAASAGSDTTFWPALATIMDNVVLPLHFTYADLGVSVQAPPAAYRLSTWTERFPPGSAVSAQAMTGPEAYLADSAIVAGITPMLDQDRTVRYVPLLVDYGGDAFASSALWAASLYQDVARTRWWLEPGSAVKIAEREVPTDEQGRLLLNFLGGPHTFKYISANDVLDGSLGTSLAKKIVVVSPTCLAARVLLKARVADDFLSGELTATAIENIITQSYIQKPSYSALFDLLIMALIGVFAAVVLPKVSLLYRFVILGAALFVILNLQYLLFASFGWLTQAFYPALLVVFFMATCPFMKTKEEIESEARRVKPRSNTVPVPVPVTESGPSRYPTSVSESTSASQLEGTMRSSFDQTALANQTGNPQSATSRLDQSVEPTRQMGSVAPDAPTRQMATSLPAGPEPEGLFVDEPAATTRVPETDATAERGVSAATGSLATGSAGSGSVSTGAPAAGTTLGRYQIIEEIGRGAMGIVYRGIDPAINRPVALKTVRLDQAVPPSEKEELRSRLLREAQAAGQLSHPNIVTVFDVGSQGDVYYIAMEYLKGYTLERAVQKRLTLNYKIFAKLMIQVCDALEYAHSNELVHRDVKPANIMVLDNFRVKVMDFGIARVTNSNMTQTGVALGTPSYISPEQLSGHGVDRRSDIFSLGVVMYELLTKDKPFSGESINKLIFNILNSSPRRPTQMDPNIPEAFDKICLKALEKDPRQRYQYAADLGRDLKEFIASLQPRRMVI